MIASHRVDQSPAFSQKTGHRRGAMFAYFMVYLMLAGATTATAGMLLHQMFRARTADVDRSHGIRQLLRTDQQLRTDWSQAVQHSAQVNLLTIVTAEQFTIVYSIDGDRLQRIVRNEDSEIQGSDRFQFPKDSVLQFVNSGPEEMAAVTFRVISPVLVQSSKPTNAKLDFYSVSGRLVEVFLISPSETRGFSEGKATVEGRVIDDAAVEELAGEIEAVEDQR